MITETENLGSVGFLPVSVRPAQEAISSMPAAGSKALPWTWWSQRYDKVGTDRLTAKLAVRARMLACAVASMW